MVSSLFTGQIIKIPEWILVTYLTHILWLNHFYMTKFPPNKKGILANT